LNNEDINDYNLPSIDENKHLITINQSFYEDNKLLYNKKLAKKQKNLLSDLEIFSLAKSEFDHLNYIEKKERIYKKKEKEFQKDKDKELNIRTYVTTKNINNTVNNTYIINSNNDKLNNNNNKPNNEGCKNQ
jgi:hypothetical protein